MLNIRSVPNNSKHPNNPREGDLFYDKNTNEFKVYHNNQWYAYHSSDIEYDYDYYLMLERKEKLEKIKKAINKNES